MWNFVKSSKQCGLWQGTAMRIGAQWGGGAVAQQLNTSFASRKSHVQSLASSVRVAHTNTIPLSK